jgi:hypothetical protein
MHKFIINNNQQINGDYEVHNETAGCSFLPLPQNRIELGYFLSCHGAVDHAKTKWPTNRINGCAFCCPLCHTT